MPLVLFLSDYLCRDDTWARLCQTIRYHLCVNVVVFLHTSLRSRLQSSVHFNWPLGINNPFASRPFIIRVIHVVNVCLPLIVFDVNVNLIGLTACTKLVHRYFWLIVQTSVCWNRIKNMLWVYCRQTAETGELVMEGAGRYDQMD